MTTRTDAYGRTVTITQIPEVTRTVPAVTETTPEVVETTPAVYETDPEGNVTVLAPEVVTVISPAVVTVISPEAVVVDQAAQVQYDLPGYSVVFPATISEDAAMSSVNAHAPEGYEPPAQPQATPVPSPDTITRDQLEAGLAALGLSPQQSAALFATFAGIGK